MNNRWSGGQRFVREVALMVPIVCGAGGSAHAQIVESQSDSKAVTAGAIEEVIVTGSRIDQSRFDTPTPVLKLSAEDLEQGARSNVALALQDMPQFKASTSPSNTGGATFPAVSPIDLRGLGNGGPPRTLVLVNGRRYVGATTTFGGGDLSLIPSSLVTSVDVVMGGASAAWGSGAVAGVANVIIGDFDGARATVETGISSQGDTPEYHVDAAYGSSFANGRGHVLFGGEYVDSRGLTPKTERKNTGGWALVTNPDFTPTNGQQPNILAPNVGIANVSQGGLITTGVNSGLAFNPDGTLRPFNMGQISGSNSLGGEGPTNDSAYGLIAPFTRYAGLGRITYDVSDSVEMTIEYRHARIYNGKHFPNPPDVSRNNITVAVDNAFLPSAIRDQMTAAGETSFRMGRWNSDLGFMDMDFERESDEFVLAFNGRLGNSWRWSADYTHGQLIENTDMANQRNVPNFNNAIDSIINPVTQQPVCRINIDAATANDDPSCVPINLFGLGNISEAAKDYVTATGYFHNKRRLDAFGLSFRGEPFELPAGPVSVAVGTEARRDFFESNVSQFDRDRVLGYVNQAEFPAQDMWTKEGFVETLVPVLSDAPLAESLVFNAAGRITNDLSGSVWSWKLGATNRVSDAVWVRAAQSRDIRSPGIQELFAPLAQIGLVNIVDPPQDNQIFTATAFAGRSGPLDPEVSNTTSVGVTITPKFIPDLSLSVDYYNITIDGSIGTISPQARVDQCYNGADALCAGIIRDADGNISRIEGGIVNLTQFKTSGFDVGIDYLLPVSAANGTWRVSSSLNYVDRFSTNDGISTVQYVGSTNSQFSLGVPRVRWNTSLFYEAEQVQANLRARFISKSEHDRNLAIENNEIPAFVYLDLGVNWDSIRSDNTNLSLYLNVNNLLNEDPPINSRNSSFYDVIGTYFTMGARVKF